MTVLAMVASLMAIAAPAGAVIDTSDACPDTIPSAGFTDLAGVPAAAVDAIDCIAFYEISTGTSATTFDPFADVERWQMALFLTRQAEIHDVTLPDGSDQGFTDLAGVPAAAVTAINQTAQLNISLGTSATTFDPFADVERWQMALFLTRLVEAAGVTLPDGSDQGFTDLAGVPDAAVVAINQLAQLEISEGTTATTFDPFADVARWQMALFLTRTLQADGITPTVLLDTFTDQPELVSVEEVSFDEDEEELVLEFTFDEDVFVEDSDMFIVYEADGTAHIATDADAASPEVEVTFEDIDEDEHDLLTTAAVAANAVESTDDGLNNPEGSVGIGDATIEGSTGDLASPLVNLEDVDWEDRDLGLNTSSFTFQFDDEITVADGDPGFSVILANGEDVIACTADGAQTDDDILVECPLSIATGDWARGMVDETILGGGAAGLFQVADERSTDTPDLVSVEILGSDRAEFTFDEQVSLFTGGGVANADESDDATYAGSLADFVIYNEDGDTVATATEAIVTDSNSVVRVQFAADPWGADTDLDDEAVGGFVNPSAVEERVGDELPNTFDEARIGAGTSTDVDSGTTTDPDLISVSDPEVSSTDLEGDPDEWEVIFTFDEDLLEGDDAGGECNAEEFRGYTAAGEIVEGIDCETDNDEATVTFDDDDVEDMVLGGVGTDAVSADDNDDSNTVGSDGVS